MKILIYDFDYLENSEQEINNFFITVYPLTLHSVDI